MAFICGLDASSLKALMPRPLLLCCSLVAVFALMATLSRSSWGDAMLYRQSYVTPIGMIAIGLLLISLKLSAISANRWLVYLQVAVLILPLAIYVRPLNKAFRLP